MRARDNPFAVQRLHAVSYRLSGLTWEEMLERLAALRFRAALVGPHGRGKTTLLEELALRLVERGLRTRTVTLHEGDRRLSATQRATLFRDLTPADVLFLDGAEQLSRLAWLEVRTRSRAAGGLVITSHRPGLLPTLHECRTTPELLAGIVEDLAGVEGYQRLPDAGELLARHGGNVRDALRELYDLCAGLTSSSAARTGSPSPPGR
jgi:GTPase SAR1 family protein